MSGEVLTVNLGEEKLIDVTALKQHLAQQKLNTRFRIVFIFSGLMLRNFIWSHQFMASGLWLLYI